jgi:insulysin
MPVPNKDEPNSVLSYFLYMGSKIDRKTRVLVALVAQMLSEPAHAVLRTKEQLGYVVLCGQITLNGASHVGIRILVQSERAPAYLEERVEQFFDTMLGVITNMDEEVFREYKVGLEKRWREKYKNLAEEASSFWAQVDSGYLDFYRSEFLFLLPFRSVLSCHDQVRKTRTIWQM